MADLIIAVDVGTGSARAGAFDREGRLLGRAEQAIATNRPEKDHVEQSSDGIWRSACLAVRRAISLAGAHPEQVAGISFDATCSLVARAREGQPLGVSKAGGPAWDTIVWLDHRAAAEAEECSATGHPVLRHLGGVMSPEMQIPKLMWLKRHLPDCWRRVGLLFDLADFLTWKASGSLERSHCTLTSKWTYRGHASPGWQTDFLEAVGLDDLLARGGLPARAQPVGHDLGPLTSAAAADLGLTRACRVGAGLIDAHAGVLGLVGRGLAEDGRSADGHLALIAGTSSSVMALSADPRPMAGVWGPSFGVVLPDLWLNDAGQSASGALLDHIVRQHGAGGEPTADMLARIIGRIAALRAAEGPAFASRLHVLPDFHGNRSPLADPQAVGVISGLRLDASFDDLCRLYWRSAVALALGVRHILAAMADRGYAIGRLHVTGGHTRNPLLMALYADATGCSLVEPVEDHAVLLGTATAAAAAAGLHPDLVSAAAAMAPPCRERRPDPGLGRHYDRDYRIFLAMHEHRRQLDALR